MSIGYVRPRGRHTDSRTNRVSVPVVNVALVGLQSLVPTTDSVETSRQRGHATSNTRKRGPLSEVISLART
jgi:hypothetical protein